MITDDVRRVLAEALRRRNASVRLTLGTPYVPFTLNGRPEGDPEILRGWRLHAQVDGAPHDVCVPITLRLDRFEKAHVENDVAIFVKGDNRLEIAPAG